MARAVSQHGKYHLKSGMKIDIPCPGNGTIIVKHDGVAVPLR